MGDGGRLTVDIHPADEDLRSLRLTLRQVEHPLAVRRPARPAALDEEPVLRAVGVDDPELGVPLVFEYVHVLPRVDDARSVRRNLRVADALQIHVVVGRQEVRRALLLRAHA